MAVYALICHHSPQQLIHAAKNHEKVIKFHFDPAMMLDAEQPLPNLVTERKLGAGEKAALPVATQHSSPPPANRDEVKPERAPLLEKELDVANLRKKSDEVKAERAVGLY